VHWPEHKFCFQQQSERIRPGNAYRKQKKRLPAKQGFSFRPFIVYSAVKRYRCIAAIKAYGIGYSFAD